MWILICHSFASVGLHRLRWCMKFNEIQWNSMKFNEIHVWCIWLWRNQTICYLRLVSSTSRLYHWLRHFRLSPSSFQSLFVFTIFIFFISASVWIIIFIVAINIPNVSMSQHAATSTSCSYEGYVTHVLLSQLHHKLFLGGAISQHFSPAPPWHSHHHLHLHHFYPLTPYQYRLHYLSLPITILVVVVIVVTSSSSWTLWPSL